MLVNSSISRPGSDAYIKAGADRALDSATILLVEDNLSIREAMVEVLEDLGYRTLATASPSEALRWLDRRPRLQVLLTDFSLPEMNGASLICAAWMRNPLLPAILCTGHSLSLAELPHPAVPLLAKPFCIQDLKAALDEATGFDGIWRVWKK